MGKQTSQQPDNLQTGPGEKGEKRHKKLNDQRTKAASIWQGSLCKL